MLGSGSWGTTLATILGRDGGRSVTLWCRDVGRARAIAARRENERYLPGVTIPNTVVVTADLELALRSDALIIAAPAQGVPALQARIAPLLRPAHRLCSATKGFTQDETPRRMSEVWADVMPAARTAVLSGPNISHEIAAGLPAPTVIASGDRDTARAFQDLLGTPMFRAYTNADVIGVELCGALKNIVALGAGAIDGMGYGVNAKAGFMTRGLVEIARYVFASGGDPLTCAGLAGFGDLIATCTSARSRNRTVGELLAKGASLADVRSRLGGQIAEGIGTTQAVHVLAAALGVEMPIVTETYRVLFEGKPVRDAMRGLMERERGEELSGPLADVSQLLRSTRVTRGDGRPPD